MQGVEKKAEEVDSRQLVEQEMVQDLEVEKPLLTFHHRQKLANLHHFFNSVKLSKHQSKLPVFHKFYPKKRTTCSNRISPKEVHKHPINWYSRIP